MKFDISPITRILLRYAVGYAAIKGILPVEISDLITNDPELLTILNVGVAAVIGAIIEGWYALAKKYNWNT